MSTFWIKGGYIITEIFGKSKDVFKSNQNPLNVIFPAIAKSLPDWYEWSTYTQNVETCTYVPFSPNFSQTFTQKGKFWVWRQHFDFYRIFCQYRWIVILVNLQIFLRNEFEVITSWPPCVSNGSRFDHIFGHNQTRNVNLKGKRVQKCLPKILLENNGTLFFKNVASLLGSKCSWSLLNGETSASEVSLPHFGLFKTVELV